MLQEDNSAGGHEGHQRTKETKERGAERAALTNTHLLNPGPSSRASHLHRESATGIQRPDGRQHAGAPPNGLQFVPQKMMLDSVIGLLEVHKAGIQRAPRDASCIDEMAQGEEVMDWRLSGPEACLDRAA